MIQRIRGRAAFARVSRDGKRIRRPALWCSWCPDSSSTDPAPTATPPTAVAFALSRALGPAVTRNRLRRRLRALCREAETNGSLPPGLLLLGASPAATELTFDQLRVEFQSLLTALPTTSVAPGAPGSRA